MCILCNTASQMSQGVFKTISPSKEKSSLEKKTIPKPFFVTKIESGTLTSAPRA